MHGRCHVRGVGFQHDGLQWQPCHHLAQSIGLRPGGGAAEAEAKAQFDVLARFLMAAGKGVDDAAARQAKALECGDGRGMGTAHVQQRRQFELGGQLQLRFEQRLLALPVQVFQVIIQTELTDGAQLAVPGQFAQPVAQLREMLRVMIFQIDRMQAERGMQVFVGLDQLPQPLPVGLVDAEHHHALHAQRAAAREYFVAVGVEVGEVQVCMGVDQAHRSAHQRAFRISYFPLSRQNKGALANLFSRMQMDGVHSGSEMPQRIQGGWQGTSERGVGCAARTELFQQLVRMAHPTSGFGP
ncbi:hypothetical protein PSEUDO8O_120555 [Pseudomonas sp. 8O]|nr:hypothetical protein PSEUDO8O_120555 [Pseudomonas sp. 8O]